MVATTRQAGRPSRLPPLVRLGEIWQPASLVVVFCVATMLVTQQLLIETGRFPAALPPAITLVGGVTMALALACLPLSNRLRFGSLALMILATVALPVSVLVVYRWHTGIPLNVHDGMFQTEIVTTGMLMGKDPYGTDFTRTALMQWFHYTQDGAAVAHHYIYYPLVVLASMPVVAIERALGLATDLRPMLLAAGALAFVLIVRLPWSWQARYAVAVILFLNPFFAWLEGRNDILWLAPILLAVLLMSAHRWTGASWALGVAAAFKVFAFPFVLFMAIALWLRWRRGLLDRRAALLSLAGLALPLAVTVVPFIVWDAGAFWRDTAGWLLDNPPGFPIYGFGLGELLLLTNVVGSRQAPFPFVVVQAVLVVPLCVLGLRQLWRDAGMANVLGPAATVLAVIILCGRFTNDSYLAALLFTFGLAIAAGRHQAPAQPRPLQEAA